MPNWSTPSKPAKRRILAVPGYNQGRGKRGAWLAWTEKIEDFFRGLKKGLYTVKYEIYEPQSKFPLSDGELQHLVQEITSSERTYSAFLHFQESISLFSYGKKMRIRGIIGLFLYLMMIFSTGMFWIIILLWPQTLLANFLNALRLRVAKRNKRIIGTFWQRGENPEIIKALNEAKEVYQKIDGDPWRKEPLRKYQYLRDYFKKKKQEESDLSKAEAYELVEQAYRDIIGQFTGRSFLIKLAPTTIRQRILHFFNMGEVYPYPDNIFAVRNLYQNLSLPSSVTSSKIIGRGQRVDGNNLEMFLLRTKTGEGIVIPCLNENIFRLVVQAELLESIQGRNLPLEAVLHVGSDKEKEALLGFNSLKPEELDEEKAKQTQMRIHNALLDTVYKQDSMMSYYLGEVPSLIGKIYSKHPIAMWSHLVHMGFPWLFISHGVPAFAVVACMWLFWEPLVDSRQALKWRGYFHNLMGAADKAYHNVELKVMVHSGLGDVNGRIMNGSSYRDVLEKIEAYHFPRKFRDMVLLNNITTETAQLKDFQREANDFVAIPAFCFDEAQGKIKPVGEVLPK